MIAYDFYISISFLCCNFFVYDLCILFTWKRTNQTNKKTRINKLRIYNTSINRQYILSSSLIITTSSSKPFPQGGLWTRLHNFKAIMVRGFYHARVKELACKIYERSKRCHSSLGLPAFVEVWISKWIDYKLEENGSNLEQVYTTEKIKAIILGHGPLLGMTSNKKFWLIKICANTDRSSEEQIRSKRL